MAPQHLDLLNDEKLWAEFRRARMERSKLAFGVLALIMVALGLGIYLFSAMLGIDADTAKIVAIAFLVAGVIDYLVLVFWGRIYKKLD